MIMWYLWIILQIWNTWIRILMYIYLQQVPWLTFYATVSFGIWLNQRLTESTELLHHDWWWSFISIIFKALAVSKTTLTALMQQSRILQTTRRQKPLNPVHQSIIFSQVFSLTMHNCPVRPTGLTGWVYLSWQVWEHCWMQVCSVSDRQNVWKEHPSSWTDPFIYIT